MDVYGIYSASGIMAQHQYDVPSLPSLSDDQGYSGYWDTKQRPKEVWLLAMSGCVFFKSKAC